MSSAVRSTGSCGTPCAPSTTVTAPAARARRTISAIGLIVPSTLDTWATATSLTRPSASIASSSSSASSPPGGDRHVAQPSALLLAQDLPGDDVGVVLHLGDEHLVALADVAPAPRVGHQVDRLGGVEGEDRARRLPVDESGDALARALEGVGRLARQLVDAAVDRRVGAAAGSGPSPRPPGAGAARWRRSRGRPPGGR